MIGIPLGLAWANVTEWLTHKYLLHGMGMKKGSRFDYHFHEHHRATRKHAGYDPGYHRPLRGWHAQTKEVAALVGASLIYLPLAPFAPFFTGAVWWSAWRYYKVHKQSHLDPEWARTHVPWHYDHHMGADQHQNWCVTKPWFDIVMGTRVPYVGTPREAADRARRAMRSDVTERAA